MECSQEDAAVPGSAVLGVIRHTGEHTTVCPFKEQQQHTVMVFSVKTAEKKLLLTLWFISLQLANVESDQC